MYSEMSRAIISGIITHFHAGLKAAGIRPFVETQNRETNSEWVEIRITDLTWTQYNQNRYCRLAVNLLCNTPSGEDATNSDFDLYRIEDMLGICQDLFVAIPIDGLPCLNPVTVAGQDMQQYRPRQVGPATNLIQASVTGFYELEV